MSDPRPEPRGLTLLDLMLLVAGVAFILSLPARAWHPHPINMSGSLAVRASAWIEYFQLHLGRFCLVPGIFALTRCARYQRPIRSPEFLALSIGWAAFLGAIRLPEVGWVNLYKFTPTGSHPDPDASLKWETAWLAAGCAGGILLAIIPVRRRLPSWVRAILLVLVWHAIVGPFAYFFRTYIFFYFPRTLWPTVLAYYTAFTSAVFLLPVAASLAGLHPRSRLHWTLMAWLALVLALATRICWPAESFLRIFVMNVSFSSAERRQQLISEYFVYPPLLLALETVLLLAWIIHRNRRAAEPPSSAHPAPSSPSHE